jgi:putative redox protein
MKATVEWHQGLSFSGKADTGFIIPLDADTEDGGANEGCRPLELMAISLAGCTAMDVLSILKKKKQEVTSFEVKVHADQAQDFPKVFTQAVITYSITGHAVDETAVVRAIELSSTKYCPAQAMLGKVVPMELVYEIYEDHGNAKKQMMKQGKYHAQGI